MPTNKLHKRHSSSNLPSAPYEQTPDSVTSLCVRN